jgi:D-hydroxyproline dehydrogenase subunit beta
MRRPDGLVRLAAAFHKGCMNAKAERVGIVGAGILGLAHAWSAAERGHHVHVFDRNSHAVGASIRNFGMIWCIGQTPELRSHALQSRQKWLRLADEAGLWVQPCGSLHLAHRDDEWELLNEYYETATPDVKQTVSVLSKSQVLECTPGAQPVGLRGGLFSNTELAVTPSQAIQMIPQFLNDRYGVTFSFSTAIKDADQGQLTATDGKTYEFDRIIICSGDDFLTLFPHLYRDYPIRRCKLHMMRTVPQPANWRLGPHLASGLTLRHYSNFAQCKTLPALQTRIHEETPELDRFGIHVMASQIATHQIVLGDSHEYDEDMQPFDRAEIDRLIVRELQKVISLPDWTLESRWHGTYAKRANGTHIDAEPTERVHLCTAVGGTGMTLSFGIAEAMWNRWSQ